MDSLNRSAEALRHPKSTPQPTDEQKSVGRKLEIQGVNPVLGQLVWA
jgi:hypothetical protein